MKRLLFVVTLITLLTLPRVVSAQPTAPRYELTACPMPVPTGVVVECGYYEVPENRTRPDSRLIRLPFAILKSQSASPLPDPVVFPSSGGPGGSSLDSLAAYTGSLYLRERDFIFVEQRGNKYAQPALDCLDVQMAMFANFTTNDAREIEIEREVAAAEVCRDQLVAQGIDLTTYNIVESAADLEALRQLLGYEQWNLVGTSYAARLVLATMRLYPDGIRSVVLDSVDNPAVNMYEQNVPTLAQALNTLFANCAADAECGAAYPELEVHFQTVIDRANAEPLAIRVTHPVTEEPVMLNLMGDDLIIGIFNALYQRNTIRFLPFIIEELYAGNASVIEPVAQVGFSNIFSRAQGMHYSAECHEEIPFNDFEQQRALASQYPKLANFLPSISVPAICAIWGAGTADAVETEAVTSDIPALVLAGEYDPITSPTFTQAAANQLSSSYFYLLPYFGHGIQDQSSCANQLAAAFISDPSRAPALDCLQNLSPLNFVTTGADILPTPLIYRLNREISASRNIAPIAAAALAVIVLIVQLGAFAVRLATRRLARWLIAPWLLATGIAVLNLLSLVWLYFIVADTDVTLLGFGLPSSASLWLLLWRVNLALTLIAVLILVWLWLKRSTMVVMTLASALSGLALLLIWSLYHGSLPLI
ncbi:MAG: alpha/beta fold hydrolase [Chloroflexi bacterium]|nr:alpha/beta fold hydrolase [Chloroflexota bacterium]